MLNTTHISGRILNRFSRDLGAIDELLARAFFDLSQVCVLVLLLFIFIYVVVE